MRRGVVKDCPQQSPLTVSRADGKANNGQDLVPIRGLHPFIDAKNFPRLGFQLTASKAFWFVNTQPPHSGIREVERRIEWEYAPVNYIPDQFLRCALGMVQWYVHHNLTPN